MKRITAIVRAEKIQDVAEALRHCGAKGFTYYDVRGHGREVERETKVFPPDMPGGEIPILDLVADVLPRIKYEILCPDADADKVCAAIREASVTGQRGDGIIYVEPVDEVIRIISGEKGDKAL